MNIQIIHSEANNKRIQKIIGSFHEAALNSKERALSR